MSITTQRPQPGVIGLLDALGQSAPSEVLSQIQPNLEMLEWLAAGQRFTVGFNQAIGVAQGFLCLLKVPQNEVWRLYGAAATCRSTAANVGDISRVCVNFMSVGDLAAPGNVVPLATIATVQTVTAANFGPQIAAWSGQPFHLNPGESLVLENIGNNVSGVNQVFQLTAFYRAFRA